ncbi:DUF2523 family protein [Xenorhabdus littoralis]|uniref:DUF2523 family protein n=1 Tax=Xenorhabdus littoralis TaxID=2582835 RepID=UPI0029E7F539|nr:DUF2523 family protein [Xenorhabdus sp. psl]MDX7990801.1 DUF2523 domain-containing protein [Xenorhabdus sp. psl]
MYKLIVSALNFAMGFMLRAIVVKFVVFFALFYIVSEFVPVLLELLPDSTNIMALFSSLPDSVWYFINFFMVTTGIKIVVSSYLTRFIIRRIPVIG